MGLPFSKIRSTASNRMDLIKKRDPSNYKKIVLLNQISTVFSLVLVPYFFILTYFHVQFLNWYILVMCFFYAGVVALNHMGYFVVSRFLFITVSNFAVFFYSSIMGRETGVHLFYFTGIIPPFLIYKVREKYGIAYSVSLSLGLFYLLWNYQFNFLHVAPLSLETQLSMFKLILPTVFFLCVCLLYYLASENASTEIQLQKNIEELVESEKRNISLLRAIPDIILRIKWDGTCLDCYFNTESGYPMVSNYSTGVSISEIFSDCHEKILFQIKTTLIQQQLNSFEFETFSFQEKKYFEARMINTSADEVISIIRDITLEKKSQQELAEQQMQLLASSKMSALGEMAGGIAHEINNPLAIIHGYSGQLKKLCQKDQVEKTQLVYLAERIIATVDRIAKTVKAMKTFSRDGSQDVYEKVDVKHILDDVLELSRENMIRDEITLKLPQLNAPVEVECQRVQISQVLLNLLTNARDAVLECSMRWIEIGVVNDGSNVLISVTDSGSGIPAVLREKIFQPFFTTKEQGKGTGLGLGISRGIIEQHRGTLELDPSSRATRFVISLPKTQPKVGVGDSGQSQKVA